MKDEIKFDNFRINRKKKPYSRNKEYFVIGNTNVKWHSIVVISSDAGAKTVWFQILALPLISSVTLDKLFNLFVPHFPL